MKVLLIQADGKIPNLALMGIADWHRRAEVRLMYGAMALTPDLGWTPDKVYISAIFKKTAPLLEKYAMAYPKAIVGGTGSDSAVTLDDVGISGRYADYSIYPHFRQSLGFTQRGCRLRCPFCVVPKKEGAVRPELTIAEIWRGDGHPKELLLLDNDFFGQPEWRERIREIRDGGFKVSFNQGINVRFITDEAAEAIASVDYRDDSMKVKRIYTAWDSTGDEGRVFAGLERLIKYGVKPDHIMVYMLVGYWPRETQAERDYRRSRLRDFGARPYPMPFERTPELVGFQRWVIGAYDKRVSWEDWQRAKYEPRNLGFAPTLAIPR